MKQILQNFPKPKVHLDQNYLKIYEQEYQINRGQKGGLLYSMIKQLESWNHRQIAKRNRVDLERILEIGAGPLNHLQYEARFEKYDIIEPNDFFFKDSELKTKISQVFKSIDEIDFSQKYTTILSIAVLEHLLDLPSVIARSALLLEPNCRSYHAIPSEGGLLWGISWRLTTAIAFKLRTGLNYAHLMRFEHVNEAQEILEIIRYFFKKVEIKRFPFPWLHFSFYTLIEASEPDQKKAKDFLLERSQ